MNGFDLPTLATLVATLGWTLLHFLWQGAVAGVLFGLALAVTSRASAPTRYRIALAFLTLLAACPVVTFLWLSPDHSSGTSAMTVFSAPMATAVLAAAASTASDWRSLIDPWLPWAVLVWAAGVTFMTGRLLVEWREVRRLTRLDIEPLCAAWQARVERLRTSLGVRRAVLVLQSTRVHVPLVVGWLKPVILVPMGALTGLTPSQLELILMHELAHVRRNDYIVNLLQIVVETLLFYHPVVRWVSRVLREERENCCDDLVVVNSGDALGYARALTELAGARSLALQTSVGSDGGKLLTRIKRIVAAREPTRVATHWSVGVLLAVFGLSLSGLLHPMAGSTPRDEASSDATTAGRPLAIEPIPSAQIQVPTLESVATPAAVSAQLVAEADAPAASGSATPPASRPASADPAPRAAAPQGAGEAPEIAPVAAPASAGKSEAAPEAAQSSATQPAAPAEAVPEPVASTQGAGPAVPTAAAPASTTPVAPSMPAARPIWVQQPEFPVAARLSGIEGWVTVSYTIDNKGRVSDVDIVDAKPTKVFDSAVRKAVRNWRFEPTVVDGQSVARRMTQTIQFSLDYKMICSADPSTGTRLNACRTKDEIERDTTAE
ncbi:MAG TPA: TonB family protein [Steroidobacteraceae bacterium]|nr:TonB family protein [Steroidobacteraceae bacterium]